MRWVIRNRSTGQSLSGIEYQTEAETKQAIVRMGSVLAEMFEPLLESDNPLVARIINEGFVKGDLQGILLPRISVDEYVPGDPSNSDNIVIAFFIKGVPEAVFPFKNFVEKSTGVVSCDFGDSETMPRTNIVYAEFDREKLDLKAIDVLMSEIGLICDLSPTDFSMSFPNTNRSYPYDIEMLGRYFRARDRHENLVAQQQAIQARTQDLQTDIERELGQGEIGDMLAQNIPLGFNPMSSPKPPPISQPPEQATQKSAPSPAKTTPINSSQKQQISTLSRNGMGNQEVAGRLGINKGTVNRYAESEMMAGKLVEAFLNG